MEKYKHINIFALGEVIYDKNLKYLVLKAALK
jgi:hypothetical protein